MPAPQLTRDQVDALQGELDALRNEVVADLGERDARYIRRTVRGARASAIAGRSLLAFGFDPFTWIAGVIALATAKILDNMEIGHNVIHGQYDWMNDPALNSQTYEWDHVNCTDHWRYSHNYRHHTYTNIQGKDDDLGYGVLRISGRQRWKPYFLLQPVWNALLAVLFQWGVGVQELKIDRWAAGRMSTRELTQRARPFVRKAARQLFKDYALFPAVCFWNAPRVFLGNLVANGIRALWTYGIIFCGHFTGGVRIFTKEETANETRGDWYLRQIQGSSNIEGGRLFHLLSGNLSHQIEHHLFPDIPAHRHAEIAPRVRALCAKYGVRYNTGRFTVQFASVLLRIFRHALPSRAPESRSPRGPMGAEPQGA
ncbi:MAG TPA: acyl-CoA desaturase [Candidatus Binatia bacterium]|nr:acyl-CoA desaturase [Candidatus Binatia bacterium]